MEILLAEDGLHPQKRSNMILPMFRSPFAVALWVVALTSPLQAMRADAFACTQSEVSLTYVRYEFAVQKDAQGVPVMDWKRFRQAPERVVTRPRRAVILENAYLKATLIPSMGRVHSLIHPGSGREQLWINPVAIPLGANNDTGFWMTWGGIEHVMPSREHGTSHALKWDGRIVIDSPQEKRVRMQTVEPLTGLKHQIDYAIRTKDPFLHAHIQVSNPHPHPVRFSHWTTSTLAPGGGRQVSPRTELVVPAKAFVPDERDFNDWMPPLVGPTETSPLKWVGQWKSIGDLMATPLLQGFYGVYAHERREGLLRVFPLDKTPGFDIWGWGYPPTEARMREFTRAIPSMGYIELWNGNVHGFSEEALTTIAPGRTLSWTESLKVVSELELPLMESMAHHLP